ncbi:MAG: phosphate acyltransferase PlsX [Dehalococcoidia bacterium]|nr:phosphate acyltransferase PlsX [Dehalococcoidia bacterium]
MADAIVLDAMGGDDAPAAPLDGAIIAAAEGIPVILVGDSEVLGRELNNRGGAPHGLRIVHAPDIVGMGDKAAREVRRQRETSLYVGTELVRDGEAAALVTMGNTGAAMATALVVLGRLKGVERPALGAVIPSVLDRPFMLLDVGANADARASHLLQFAHMGSAYMRSVHHVESPRVALLSIGEESSKGSTLVTETHSLLERTEGLRFIGNIESRELLSGNADVIVTDGFTGNICIKLAEGLVEVLFAQMRTAARSSLRSKVGGALLLPSLRGVRDRLDYRAFGAVPLLGVQGGVFIGHGRSDGAAVATALRNAYQAAHGGMLGALEGALQPSSRAASDTAVSDGV